MTRRVTYKPPRSVLIGAHRWRVAVVTQEYCDEVADDCLDNGESAAGLCWPARRTIYLSRELDGLELLDSFMHEVEHAFEAEYGYRVPHWIVEKQGTQWARFIVANPRALNVRVRRAA